MKRLSLLSAVLCLCACHPTKEYQSQVGVTQLTQRPFACVQWPQARVDSVISRLSANFLLNWTNQNSRQILYNEISGLPNQYTDYFTDMADKGRFYVTQRALGGSIQGVTSFGGSSGNIALSNTDFAVEFATQHEFGHAVQFLYRSGPAINEPTLETLMQEGKASGKLRSYAISDTAEYFAESFSNYYCSPEAHDFIVRELPKTYAYLQTVLEKPMWLTPAPGGGEKELPNNLFVKLDANPIEAYKFNFFLTAPVAANEVFVCVGEIEGCKEQKNIHSRLSPRNVVQGSMATDQRLFGTDAPVDFIASKKFNVIALDAAKNVIAARELSYTINPVVSQN